MRAAVLEKPEDYDEVQRYLLWFERRMLELNGHVHQGVDADVPGERAFVHPEAVIPFRDGGAAARAHSEYSPTPDERDLVQQIRQHVRVITDLAQGADDVSAPVATLNRQSRLVRDVVKLLDRSRNPMVLLGQPGGGKSTVLREIALRYAVRARRHGLPMVPVYVVLGAYRSVNVDGTPGDVASLVARSIPRQFTALGTDLWRLLDQRRLVVFFDGMDEMDRDLYTERTRKLSDFAFDYRLQAKTLFACRVANFSPAFEHRQVVLQPFSPAKIREYIRRNFPVQTAIGEASYSRKQIAQRLLGSVAFRGTAQIPLTLFLLRYYITHKHAWPERRHELFGTYISLLSLRLKAYFDSLGQKGAAESLDQIEQGWDALAYRLMVHREGTCLSRVEFDDQSNELGDAKLAEWAERAGLLRPELSMSADGSDALEVTLRFSHHQIQEYLAARYMVAHDPDPALDWAAVIDSPRWQETLIHAVSINRGGLTALQVIESTFRAIDETYTALEAQIEQATKARQTLQKELDAIKPIRSTPTEAGTIDEYSPEQETLRASLQATIRSQDKLKEELPFSIPAEQERVWADRVVLGSQLLKEAGGTPQSLREPIPALYATSVRHLAKRGRPPSQVKMLWAFGNAPEVCQRSDLTTPFRSPIAWVRDQAIATLGTLSGPTGADLDEELLFDVSNGRILSRLPSYVRAAAGRVSRLAAMVWAVVCYGLQSALVVGTAFALAATALVVAEGIGVHQAIPFFERYGHPADAIGLVWGASVVVVAATITIRGWPMARRFPLTVGLLASTAVALFAARPGAAFDRWPTSGLAAVTSLAIGLVAWLAFRGVLFVCAVPLRWLRGRHDARAMVARVVELDDAMPEGLPIVIGGLAASAVLIAALVASLFWLLGQAFERVKPYAGAGTIAVIVALVVGVILWLYARSVRKRRVAGAGAWATVRADALSTLLFVAVGTVLIGSLALMVWLIQIIGETEVVRWLNSLWQRWVIDTIFRYAFGALLAIVGVVFALAVAAWWIKSVLILIRYRLTGMLPRWLTLGIPIPGTVDRWRQEFVEASPFGQALLLQETTHTSLRVSVRDFLKLLEECEVKVTEDPAATLYWSKRHDLEEILKQEQSTRPHGST